MSKWTLSHRSLSVPPQFPSWWPYRPWHPRVFRPDLSHTSDLTTQSDTSLCQISSLFISGIHPLCFKPGPCLFPDCSTATRSIFPTARVHILRYQSNHSPPGLQISEPLIRINPSDLGQQWKEWEQFLSQGLWAVSLTLASSYLYSIQRPLEGEKISKCAFEVRQISKG